MYTYGIINANGQAIEGVTVQSTHNAQELVLAQIHSAKKGGDVEKHLSHVHRDQMKKRFASDGAQETRYFPIQ